MADTYLDNIVNRFIEVVKDLRIKQIICDRDLKYHRERDVHSWLQYAMIEAGRKCGLLTVPEIKLRFEIPIDFKDFKLGRKGKRHFLRADVAFYDDSRELLGVSEIFTMDEAHGALPSTKLAEVEHNWLTPKDSLIHMIRHAKEKPRFIILVVILLKESPRIWWPTGIDKIDSKLRRSRNYYEVFLPNWKEFLGEIEIQNSMVILSEDDIERV